jgi:hypothetical protein
MAYVTVAGGLHSFVHEIARVSKTSGAHYSVRHDGDSVVTVEHHRGRWRARTAISLREIVVETDDGRVMRVVGNTIELDGMPVERICPPGYGCFDAAEIRRRVAAALALQLLVDAGYDIKTVVRVATDLTGRPP